MPLEVTCDCGMFMRVNDDLAGRTVTCPQCSQSLILPLSLEEAPLDLVDFEPDQEEFVFGEAEPEPSADIPPGFDEEIPSEACPMCGTLVEVIEKQCPDCGEPLHFGHATAPPPPLEVDNKLIARICSEFRAIGMFWIFLGAISLAVSIIGFSATSQRLEKMVPLVPLVLGTILVLSWGMLISGIITAAREVAGLYAGVIQSYIFVGLLGASLTVAFLEEDPFPIAPAMVITLVVLILIVVQAHATIRVARRLKKQGVNLKSFQD